MLCKIIFRISVLQILLVTNILSAQELSNYIVNYSHLPDSKSIKENSIKEIHGVEVTLPGWPGEVEDIWYYDTLGRLIKHECTGLVFFNDSTIHLVDSFLFYDEYFLLNDSTLCLYLQPDFEEYYYSGTRLDSVVEVAVWRERDTITKVYEYNNGNLIVSEKVRGHHSLDADYHYDNEILLFISYKNQKKYRIDTVFFNRLGLPTCTIADDLKTLIEYNNKGQMIKLTEIHFDSIPYKEYIFTYKNGLLTEEHQIYISQEFPSFNERNIDHSSYRYYYNKMGNLIREETLILGKFETTRHYTYFYY